MDIQLRRMERKDWPEVATLIYESTNAWYQANGRPPIFSGPKSNTELFCSVYENLDPGCCIVAEDAQTGSIAGSCFFHPRDTHVSLGIMNSHPDYFSQGIARRLLNYITDFADQANKPVRLVSSAINLDSFSLYNRAGFVPRVLFQDMTLEIGPDGIDDDVPGSELVRAATLDDLPEMVALERQLVGIERAKDYEYFVTNKDGFWNAMVIENSEGGLDGFLSSVNHPGCNMLGPGLARTEKDAIGLIFTQLNHHRGRTPVWLVPCEAHSLVEKMYVWGARNIELHMAQVRGHCETPRGVIMPTFMPETG